MKDKAFRVRENQVNIKCVFCGAMIPSRRLDAISSELLAIIKVIDDQESLFCSEECYQLFLEYY